MILSVITAKSQTTLPTGVRKALGVRPGDRLAYVVEGDRAIIRKADVDGDDPVIGAFLDFIARDVGSHPERLTGLPPDLVERARALAKDIVVNLDEPVEGDVEI